MKFKEAGQLFKRELKIYQLVLNDSRTPLIGKIFLGIAVGYLLLPFDLVPDFIPILGQLDDLIIVPLLVYLALKVIPSDLIKHHRDSVSNN